MGYLEIQNNGSNFLKSDLWISEAENGEVIISTESDQVTINSDQAIEIIVHLRKQFNLYGH